MQGDGCRNLILYRFKSGERVSAQGLILSNTCDMSSQNTRYLPVSVTFAPIMSVEGYKKLSLRANRTDEQILQKIKAIKSQQVTNMFYLPKGRNMHEEGVVLFNDIHSMPVSALSDPISEQRNFTLSMAGFYILLFKLSVHFCRVQEGMQRNPISD